MKRLLFFMMFIGSGIITGFSQDSIVFIPDTSFLYALIDEGADKDGDSLISYLEARGVSELIIENKGITDLKGLEAFTHLEILICDGNPLQMPSLDLTDFSALRKLSCIGTYIHDIKLDGCIELTDLIMQDCSITNLDLSVCPKLKYLDCAVGQLMFLNVSGCKDLEELYCSYNYLGSLDVSHHLKLRRLVCSANNIYFLDVSYCPELEHLTYGGGVRELDISRSPKLGDPDIPGAYLSLGYVKVCTWTDSFPPEGYNVSYDEQYTVFSTECGGNAILTPDSAFFNALIEDGVDMDGDSTISYDEAELITSLNLTDNLTGESKISDLTGIEKFIHLDTLVCADHELTSLNLSENHYLTKLDCSGNMLTDLDLSNNSFLHEIDLQDMPALGAICVWNTPFPFDDIQIDTSGSPNVTFSTNCGYNDSVIAIPDTAFLLSLIQNGVDTNGDSLIGIAEALKVLTLDVSVCGIKDMSGIEEFKYLENLNCSHNLFTALDLSNNTELRVLDYSYNDTYMQFGNWRLTQLTHLNTSHTVEYNLSLGDSVLAP